MLRQQLFTQLRSQVCKRSTASSYHKYQSNAWQNPSPRGSYAQGVAMRPLASNNITKKHDGPKVTSNGVEIAHLTGIGIVTAISSVALFAIWIDTDETKRTVIENLIESEELRDEISSYA